MNGTYHNPLGIQDHMPLETQHKSEIQDRMRRLFARRGYRLIEPAIVEYLEVFTNPVSAIPPENMFTFTDGDGRILVLRPEMTTPVARIAATRLREEEVLRLGYMGPVFHYQGAEDTASLKEFDQMGMELMGLSGAGADAEIIALAVEALRESGLTDFFIDLGQVEFFKGLAQEAGLSEAEAEELRRLVEKKDMLAMEMLLISRGVSQELRGRILALPLLYGGEEVIHRARSYSAHPRCQAALDNLAAIMEALRQAGVADAVRIDLGLVQSLGYYTGAIFRGICRELGTPLVTGGRYDKLVAQFGRDMPATGFALSTKPLMIALERQGAFTAAAAPAEPAPLKIALAKGRLAEKMIDLLEACGIDCSQVRNPDRKLVLRDATGAYEFILVKPSDVPTYVDRGAADIGVAGKDTLLEQNRPLYEMLDLGYGKCRLCVAGFPQGVKKSVTGYNLRVATKYPQIARSYYAAKGEAIDIIHLNGSVELGPLVGLSDVILDIVESGGTLRANGLAVLEEICPVSARLVVNRVSLKTRSADILPLIEKIKAQLPENHG